MLICFCLVPVEIGKNAAKNIQAFSQSNLKYVLNVYAPASGRSWQSQPVRSVSSVDEALGRSKTFIAVLIATSTDTHVELNL